MNIKSLISMKLRLNENIFVDLISLNSYEMQVEKEYQRKGLGKFIMNALEKMARHYEMEKLILTVLSNNESAITFFKALGFGVDDTSPDAAENSGYQILSKLLL